MNDRLKQLIHEQKQDFDCFDVPDGVWEKIDSQLDLMSARPITSRWLSKYKNLAFSASALVIAVFFVTMKLNRASQLITRGSARIVDHEYYSTHKLNNTHAAVIQDSGGIVKEPSVRKQKDNFPGLRSHQVLPDTALTSASAIETEEVLIEPLVAGLEDPGPDPTQVHAAGAGTLAEKAPEVVPPPAWPVAINTYEGTLYVGFSFCDLLKIYTFPGRLSLQKGKGITRLDEGNKPTVKTISCSRIDKSGHLSAVWIKGRTDHELTISVKKRFKNIYLLKPDGRKLRPKAISHYYPGLGVIQEYSGKYFNLIYKDNVELILFFQDAEPGDRVVVDQIEAAITGRR